MLSGARRDRFQRRDPVVESRDLTADHLRGLVGPPQHRRVGPVRIRRERGRLVRRHRAALELEAERAAVAEPGRVLGVGRDEVALRGDVEHREPRHARAEQRLHPGGADLAVVDRVEVAEHVPHVVDEPGDLELAVVGCQLLELVGALQRVGEDVDRVAELAERVEHPVARREPLEDLGNVGGGRDRIGRGG